MRNVLFIFIFLFSSLANSKDSIVLTKEIESTELLKLLEGFADGVNIKKSILCNEDFENLNISSCDHKDIKGLLEDYETSRVFINRLIDQVNEYNAPRNNKSSNSQLKKIKKRLNCISDKMNSLKLKCRKENKICETAIAYVNHSFSTFRDFFDTVSICPNYLNSDHPKSFRSGVLIHEISHLCGARDHHYFNGPYSHGEVPSVKLKRVTRRHPKTRRKIVKEFNLDISANNADTYEYWSRYGFCLPMIDCNKN